MTERRILFVHAHPDDECIPTGITLAKYAADGADVVLVTCTRGEVCEIVVAADPARFEGEPWQVPKLYYTTLPKSVLAKAFDYFKASGSTFFEGAETVDDLPLGDPDELVTTVVSAPEHLARKQSAMRAHR